MFVTVMGKETCGKCKSYQDKLIRLQCEFVYIPMDNPGGAKKFTLNAEGKVIPNNIDWRETNAAEMLADATVSGLDLTHPPITCIDYTWYTDFVEVIKGLKAGTIGATCAESKPEPVVPVPPTNVYVEIPQPSVVQIHENIPELAYGG